MQKKLLLVSILSFILLLSLGAIVLGCPAPELISITPNSGLNNQSIDVVITGAKFHKSAYAKLTKAGEPDIIATNLNITKTEITCTFDLTGRAPGVWDLVVGNVGSFSKKEKPAENFETFTIEKVIEVKAPVQEEAKAEPQPEVVEEEPAPVDPNEIEDSIYFDFDKSNIRADQVYYLDSNVAIIKENPAFIVVLGGHADERGTKEYNIKLSARRAETVKKYFVSKGIAADRIIVYAYGEEYPAAKGHNESAWSLNRRVDISCWERVPTKEEALEKAPQL
jgi:peptidoglycan-associated lipoprotein